MIDYGYGWIKCMKQNAHNCEAYRGLYLADKNKRSVFQFF